MTAPVLPTPRAAGGARRSSLRRLCQKLLGGCDSSHTDELPLKRMAHCREAHTRGLRDRRQADAGFLEPRAESDGHVPGELVRCGLQILPGVELELAVRMLERGLLDVELGALVEHLALQLVQLLALANQFSTNGGCLIRLGARAGGWHRRHVR